MGFIGMILTESGRSLMASAISEDNPLKITHIQMGDGSCDGSFSKKKALSQMVMQLPVKSVKRNGGEVVVNCDFNSKEAPKGFYFREIGIIGNGVLCYYDNSGEDAEYIDPGAEAVVKQKRLRFTLKISNDVSVQVNITSGLYALKEEVEADVGELRDVFNEALVDKVDKTGDVSNTTAAFTQAADRTNIRTGEKMSAIFGKIAKWFADLKTVAFTANYADLSGRPTIPAAVAVKGNAESSYRTGNVNLTPANIGAAASGHTHSYAGSSSAGGAATSAVKLASSAGSELNPVYFSGGKPVACAGSIGKMHTKKFIDVSTDEYQLANSVGLGEGYIWPCYYNQFKEIPAFSDIESYKDTPINIYVRASIPGAGYSGIAHYVLWDKKFYLLGQNGPCPNTGLKPFVSCTAGFATFIGIKVSEAYKVSFSLTICAIY